MNWAQQLFLIVVLAVSSLALILLIVFAVVRIAERRRGAEDDEPAAATVVDLAQARGCTLGRLLLLLAVLFIVFAALASCSRLVG